jgi:hypothetical protein
MTERWVSFSHSGMFDIDRPRLTRRAASDV